MHSNSSNHTLLSLGDSYTIGEGVLLAESYPYQAAQLLRQKGHAFTAPEIIARTGWTTDELASAIAATRFLTIYDFVTLLIGVNNQYRGRSVEEYSVQFQSLLKQALAFAGQRPERVLILSIPDWSVSPFAAGLDKAAIGSQIDLFNAAAEAIAFQHKVSFIDITAHSRGEGRLFTADGLHPDHEQYRFWAGLLAESIARQIYQ